jgi:5-(carboxyamino)imidazole ribonucleotide mutase
MIKLIEIRTGSDSDMPKIQDLYAFLDSLFIPYSKRILSAHRTPDRMADQAQKLESNSFRVSIAAAGGSAHIAGMTASETSVPVVALPVLSSLGGIDALLSMAQMPPGIPNGCVGINDSEGAGILAIRIAYLDNAKVLDLLSQKLGTSIVATLGKSPRIDIFTDQLDLDTSLLDRFGIVYEINPTKRISPVALYVADIAKLPELVPENIEQISILAGKKNDLFKLTDLESIISGPYAWVGVERVNNGMIYAAQVLGIYFPAVREAFKTYKKELYDQVVAKDIKLQQTQ